MTFRIIGSSRYVGGGVEGSCQAMDVTQNRIRVAGTLQIRMLFLCIVAENIAPNINLFALPNHLRHGVCAETHRTQRGAIGSGSHAKDNTYRTRIYEFSRFALLGCWTSSCLHRRGRRRPLR
jgi:hypothetical protein